VIARIRDYMGVKSEDPDVLVRLAPEDGEEITVRAHLSLHDLIDLAHVRQELVEVYLVTEDKTLRMKRIALLPDGKTVSEQR
jgi:hypothetical protein